MGPFAMADLAGIDIGWRARKAIGASAPVADAIAKKDVSGKRPVSGFYLYQDGARKGERDPETEALIVSLSDEPVSSDVNSRRTKFSPVPSIPWSMRARRYSKRALPRGRRHRSRLDNGYGFPVAKGGPMFWAQRIGLERIVRRLEYWHGVTGKPVFQPAPLLRQAAQAGTWTAKP